MKEQRTSENEVRDAELLPFGYAPGNYTSRCLDCDGEIWHVDKRCRVCRPCAVKRMVKAMTNKTETLASKTLAELEAWIASDHGRVYSCTRQYPHPGYACNYRGATCELVIPAGKAPAALCQPHGKDWLTCPECARDAVNGGVTP